MREIEECRDSRFRTRARALALAALMTGSVLAPRTAHAEEVKPTAKGITGCALLGGELVVFGEAIFGVRSPSAYLLGAGIGAVAGGVGGYFLEQGVDDGRVPAYTLAGGLALIVPAVVVALDQTRYLPTEGAREDKPANLPPSDPGKPGGSAVIGAEPAPAPATPPASGTPGATPAPSPTPAPAPAPGGAGGGGKPAPQSLFDIHSGDFRVGVPIPAVRPVFSTAEKKKLGVESSANEVRFPVVHVTF
jgi:hypothetical protein